MSRKEASRSVCSHGHDGSEREGGEGECVSTHFGGRCYSVMPAVVVEQEH